jgi:hypothetical protein
MAGQAIRQAANHVLVGHQQEVGVAVRERFGMLQERGEDGERVASRRLCDQNGDRGPPSLRLTGPEALVRHKTVAGRHSIAYSRRADLFCRHIAALDACSAGLGDRGPSELYDKDL